MRAINEMNKVSQLIDSYLKVWSSRTKERNICLE